MNRVFTTGMAALAFATLAGSLMAHDDDDRGRDRDGRFTVRANLEGFQEVPAISTVASGRFRAVIDTKANTITWKPNYDAGGRGHAVPRALRPVERQRWNQFFPVHEPGKWPCRDADLSGGTVRNNVADHPVHGDRSHWYRYRGRRHC